MKLQKKIYIISLIGIHGHIAVAMQVPMNYINRLKPIKKISHVACVGTDAQDEIIIVGRKQGLFPLYEDQQKEIEYFKGKSHSFPSGTYLNVRSLNNNYSLSVSNELGIVAKDHISNTEQSIFLGSDISIDALAINNSGSLIAKGYKQTITSWFLHSFDFFHEYLLKLYITDHGKYVNTEIKSFDSPIKALSFDSNDLLAVGSANVLSFWKLVGCRIEKIIGYKVAHKNEEICGLQFIKDDSSQLVVGTDKRIFMVHAGTGDILHEFDYPAEFIPKKILCSSKCIGLVGSENDEYNTVFFWQNPLREITIMKKLLAVASKRGLFDDVVIFLGVRNQNE